MTVPPRRLHGLRRANLCRVSQPSRREGLLKQAIKSSFEPLSRTQCTATCLPHGGPGTGPARCAVFSHELTRAGVWDALYDRRCYATSGTHILLFFPLNSQPMGTELVVADPSQSRAMQWSVSCTGPLKRVELHTSRRDDKSRGSERGHRCRRDTGGHDSELDSAVLARRLAMANATTMPMKPKTRSPPSAMGANMMNMPVTPSPSIPATS